MRGETSTLHGSISRRVQAQSHRWQQLHKAGVVLTRVFAEDRADPAVEVPVDYEGGPVRSILLEFQAPDARAVLLFQSVGPDGQKLGDPRSVLVVG